MKWMLRYTKKQDKRRPMLCRWEQNGELDKKK